MAAPAFAVAGRGEKALDEAGERIGAAIFAEGVDFTEKSVPGKSRYGSFLGLEEKYATRNLLDPALRAQVKAEMKSVIEMFRER